MRDFVFVTGNKDKITMLESFLGYSVQHHDLDLSEIQSLDVYEVTERKAKDAYRVINKPVLVDDVSLEISSLNGLPGPFIKFFLKSIDCKGVCKMADISTDRSATARLVFGFFDGENYRYVDGVIRGSIAKQPKGDVTKLTQMGWNSIFIPDGQSKTIAEMEESDLINYTPRGIAVFKLKKLLN